MPVYRHNIVSFPETKRFHFIHIPRTAGRFVEANLLLNDIEWDGNNVLVFGSEGYGIKKHTEKYIDFIVKIKINSKIESLNLSNSAAIAFNDLTNGKKK